MGETLGQLAEFRQNTLLRIQEPALSQLAQQLAGVINQDHLAAILQYIQSLPDEKLSAYKPAYGEMFLRKDTKLAFSFYIGRDYAGNFQLIVTHNGKAPDGTPGVALVKKGGTYKVGKVARGIDLASGTVDKIFRLTILDMPGEADIEMEFSELVNSPFVARYFASETYNNKGLEDTTKTAVFLKYAGGGDLWNFCVDAKHKSMPLVDKLQLIYSILAGLRHIHNSIDNDLNLRHRDVKLPNMLLMENGCVQYIDFGGWREEDKSIRTYLFSPPEFIDYDVNTRSDYKDSAAEDFWASVPQAEWDQWAGRISGMKADVWGAGLSIHLLCFGIEPHPARISGLPSQYAYLNAMLQTLPDKRCTADEALKLFLQCLEKTLTVAEQQQWLNQLMVCYTDDFHRMQFISELYAAGCVSLLTLIPFDKQQLLDYEKLLEWPGLLSLSEWCRIRDYYQQYLDEATLIKFNEKLYKRPELTPALLGASLWHAARTNDGRVLSFLLQRRADVSNLFRNIVTQNAIWKYAELLKLGISPWQFAGSYNAETINWLLRRTSNVELLKKLLSTPLHRKQLPQVIAAMVANNAHQHWQELLAQQIKAKTLKTSTIKALCQAGVPEQLIRGYLRVHLQLNKSAIEFYFNSGIFDWIVIPKQILMFSESVNYAVAMQALQRGCKRIYSMLVLNKQTLLQTLLATVKDLKQQETYLKTLLGFGVDIWHEVTGCTQLADKLLDFLPLNLSLLKKYLLLPNIPIESVRNLIQAQLRAGQHGWQAVVEDFAESQTLTRLQVNALLQAGVPHNNFIASVAPIWPEFVPELCNAGLSMLEYIKWRCAWATSSMEKLQQLTLLHECYSEYIHVEQASLVAKIIECLSMVVALRARENSGEKSSTSMLRYFNLNLLRRTNETILVDSLIAVNNIATLNELVRVNPLWFKQGGLEQRSEPTTVRPEKGYLW